ncbi:MAG: deoxyribose-phosphate aldolase [Clostridia bacterium]|nr:deoxyribose-phosphate aldolase [Clostridia bacterium]
MDITGILSAVDHTLLKQESTWDQIREICEEAMHYHTASICIPPCFVSRAKAYMEERPDRVRICTVIGFPNGYSTTKTKVFEAGDAVACGADEIDMVINVGMVTEGRDEEVLREINAVKSACQGRLLKVIIETCLLTEAEKIRMCSIVSESNADFIKTSTGFSTGGATFEDIALMKKHMAPGKGIKAAGGISTLQDAERFLELGATRLGTSRIIRLVRELDKPGT